LHSAVSTTRQDEAQLSASAVAIAEEMHSPTGEFRDWDGQTRATA
jgi:hypothetical protein